ncbi:hypothetical protein BT93_H3664 [Corymbia citriodora subsp. variegata]|nr:hypothetical protein BT93_H3664 [Corymbia citriodora subsp. variegata]
MIKRRYLWVIPRANSQQQRQLHQNKNFDRGFFTWFSQTFYVGIIEEVIISSFLDVALILSSWISILMLTLQGDHNTVRRTLEKEKIIICNPVLTRMTEASMHIKDAH